LHCLEEVLLGDFLATDMSLYTGYRWLCRLSNDQQYKVQINEDAYTSANMSVTMISLAITVGKYFAYFRFFIALFQCDFAAI